MKTIISIIFSLAIYSQANCQSIDFQWVKQLGGPGPDNAEDMVLDPQNNIITVGGYSGWADFDPGPLTYCLTTSNSPLNVFISKLDADGNFIWAKQLGQQGSFISAYGVTTDTAGNIYVTGEFNGTLDFDPGPQQHDVTGNWEAYALKLTPSGDFQWVYKKPGSKGKAIAVDASGKVFITGEVGGEVFVSCLDPTGNPLWNYKAIGKGSSTHGASIDCSSQGNVFISGIFNTKTNFDPNGIGIHLEPNSGLDAFVLKLNNAGGVLWAKQIAGNADEYGAGIRVDQHENSYSTGTFRSKTDFDPGPGEHFLTPNGFYGCYILKLDQAGNFVWARKFDGTGGSSFGHAIALDHSANVFVTSSFFGKINRFNSRQVMPLTTDLYDDTFVLMCDPAGNFKWAAQLGGDKHDGGRAIAPDNSGNIITAGFFRNTSDFDPFPGTHTMTSFGDVDVFIHKMSLCTPEQSLTISSGRDVLCVKETATVTASGAVTYTWLSGSNAHTLEVSPESYYYLYGTDSKGCSSSVVLSQSVSLCQELPLKQEQHQIKIFPNPSAGNLTVSAGNSFNICLFELVDIDGTIITQGKHSFSEHIMFDFSSLNIHNGIYLLKLTFDGKTTIIKVAFQTW